MRPLKVDYPGERFSVRTAAVRSVAARRFVDSSADITNTRDADVISCEPNPPGAEAFVRPCSDAWLTECHYAASVITKIAGELAARLPASADADRAG
jgi:hypothetical protein